MKNFKRIYNKRIDLHIHTLFSDGACSPLEILQKCKEQNLQIASITDHDCIDAYKELKNVNIKDYVDELIYGCEFVVKYKNYSVEVLGYDFDFDKLSKINYLTHEYIMNIRQGIANHHTKVAQSLGFVIADGEAKVDYGIFDSKAFTNAIKNHEENKELIEKYDLLNKFYRKHCCNPNSPFFMNSIEAHSLEEISKLVHEAGGVVILAHPLNVYTGDQIQIIQDIYESGLVDGFECKYYNFTKEQSDYMIEFCDKRGLLKSGGSDYHGESRSAKVGRTFNASEPIIIFDK